MKSNLFSLLLLILFCLPSEIAFCQSFDDVTIEAQKLSDNIYVLMGAGGNIGLCLSENGALMIDDQFAPLSERILKAVAEITDQPVRYVVNSHWHGDHTGGNENMGKQGSVIVAHENVRERMSKDQLMAAFKRTVPAAPEVALPNITFTDNITFYWGAEKIEVNHIEHAHTDGDSYIYFSESNVLHTGDVYFQGKFPFIDNSSGGSINGMIEGINTLLEVVNDETQIIPGHGTVSNKAELLEYRDMLVEVRDGVQAAMKTEKDLKDIQKMEIAPDYIKKGYGDGFMKKDKFLEIVYLSLLNEK